MIDRFDKENSWLSNFAPAKVMYENIEYASIEHAYQAAKTLDLGQRAMIKTQISASFAKRAGKSLTLRPDWLEIRGKIMKDLLRQKFARPMYRDLLLDTGNQQLVEGNWWHDTYWGSCMCDRHRGTGENILGHLLMDVREELRREAHGDRA